MPDAHLAPQLPRSLQSEARLWLTYLPVLASMGSPNCERIVLSAARRPDLAARNYERYQIGVSLYPNASLGA